MMSGLPTAVLHVLNIGLFVVHSGLIAFNLTGWIFPRTRKLHLICVGATLFSWFAMGAYRGFGYCLCTDWHFQIRRTLDLPVNSQTYLQLMSQVFFGIPMNRFTSDVLAGGGLLLIVIVTLFVWVRSPAPDRLPQKP